MGLQIWDLGPRLLKFLKRHLDTVLYKKKKQSIFCLAVIHPSLWIVSTILMNSVQSQEGQIPKDSRIGTNVWSLSIYKDTP